MSFKNKLKNIDERIKSIKNNKTKIEKIMTKEKLLPSDKLNRGDIKLMNNFIHPTIIKNRINTLKSKRQTTIGKKKM